MKFILGKKVEMTQIFDANGKVVPATLVLAGPINAMQVKTKEKDGYEAVQFGFEKNKKSKQAKKGFRFVKEFRTDDHQIKIGDAIDVSVFQEGDIVAVSGITKGKGFQGVVKRHGFHGGPRTHGQKHSEREPGSIGATWPQRVLKGKRMAGRMGSDRVTVKNLKIVQVDKDKNQILISGAVPGKRGTLLEIRSVK